MKISFYGVRGSTPCCAPELQRYGGNTSCVVVESGARSPLILDLGTGLRFFGQRSRDGQPFRGTALVSHLHWDHVQGLPFFAPVLAMGAELDVYAPACDGRSAREAFDQFMAPPFFPVGLEALPGRITIHDTPEARFEVDGWSVTGLEVPHVGRTLGYRISDGVHTIAYIPDHQQPELGSTTVAPNVVELAEDVDVLIHDAQFDDAAFVLKPDWGHCTVSYAVEVAAAASVSTLALFHHDPSHDDGRVDRLAAEARELGAARGVHDVIAAAEGSAIDLAGRPAVDANSISLRRGIEVAF